MNEIAAKGRIEGSAVGSPILRRWRKWSRLPGGKTLFSMAVGRMARYTGTISPRVRELEAGYCRVQMKDRPAVRNHLRSVHAIALMNLAEVSSGLAMLAGVDASMRSILTGLSIEYTKKARGTLTAECRCPIPTPGAKAEHEIVAVITNVDGDEVARARARWLVGPSPS